MKLFIYRKACGLAAIALLMQALGGEVVADQSKPDRTADAKELRGDGLSSGALYVPVYPKAKEFDPEQFKKAPLSQSLGSSYILLEDGSALSVADWILGGLNKNQFGADMSDYESRLFLGQVARAMVGKNQDLTHQSLVYTGPTVSYRLPPPPKGFEAVWKNVAGLVMSTILPGTPDDFDYSKTGNSFSKSMIAGDGAAILFQNQFHGSHHAVGRGFQRAWHLPEYAEGR